MNCFASDRGNDILHITGNEWGASRGWGGFTSLDKHGLLFLGGVFMVRCFG